MPGTVLSRPSDTTMPYSEVDMMSSLTEQAKMTSGSSTEFPNPSSWVSVAAGPCRGEDVDLTCCLAQDMKGICLFLAVSIV